MSRHLPEGHRSLGPVIKNRSHRETRNWKSEHRGERGIPERRGVSSNISTAWIAVLYRERFWKGGVLQ